MKSRHILKEIHPKLCSVFPKPAKCKRELNNDDVDDFAELKKTSEYHSKRHQPVVCITYFGVPIFLHWMRRH